MRKLKCCVLLKKGGGTHPEMVECTCIHLVMMIMVLNNLGNDVDFKVLLMLGLFLFDGS